MPEESERGRSARSAIGNRLLRRIWERIGERRLENIFIGAACLWHTVKTAYLLKGVSLSNPWPLTSYDYILYYARALRVQEFMERSGRFWGYDPFDMAGYPAGPIHEAGNHLISLVCYFLSPFFSIKNTLLTIEIGGLFLMPFALVLFVRLLGGTRFQSWFAFALYAISSFIFDNGAHVAGLLGFSLGSYASLLISALFYRWIRDDRPIYWFGFTILACVAPQLHPMSVIIFSIPVLIVLLARIRSLRLQHGFLLIVSIGMTVLLNWYWIGPYLLFRDWLAGSTVFTPLSLTGVVTDLIPIKPIMLGYLKSSLFIFLLCCSYLLLRSRSKKEMAFRVAFGAWLAWLAFLFYFGNLIEVLKPLQTRRFGFPLWILCCGLAALQMPRPKKPISPTLKIGLALMLIIPIFNIMLWNKWVLGYNFTIHNRLPEEPFLNHLKEAGPMPGRLLVETIDVWPGGVHFADIIPHITGQAVIGGPIPYVTLKTKNLVFSGKFWKGRKENTNDPIAFNHRLSQMSEAQFSTYLDLYNVHAVAARTPAVCDILKKYTNILSFRDYAHPYHIYDVRKPSGWFVKGSGDVKLDYDKILIRNASKGTLVLKSHWINTLATEPLTPSGPIWLGEDPVPFISIDNSAGHTDLAVVNR